MELEIYSAFVKAGINETDAKNAVESISREIDSRYKLHSEALATKADIASVKTELAEAKIEIIKWTVATMFAAVALFATITKIWH